MATGNQEYVDISFPKGEETPPFFMAIAKQGIHSFIMLGMLEDTGEPSILTRIGKSNSIDPGYESDCRMALKQVFSKAKARLESESLRLRGEISYVAYDITYQQYLEFMALMAFMPSLEEQGNKNEIYAYQPVEAQDDADRVTLKYQAIQKKAKQDGSEDVRSNEIYDKSKYLDISNTCRHTAMALLKYTQGVERLRDNVSSCFFRSLPLRAKFSYGKPTEKNSFYIFPQPPNAFKEVSKETQLILTKIYKRMENLLKKDPTGENTREKFNALKKLYNDQSGPIKDKSLNDVLHNILEWKEKNQSVISQLRKQSFLGKLFVSKSSTLKLVEDLEKELNRRVKP